MDDSEFLRQFVSTRSPEAFAALVRCYADMVYSAARRQMGQGDLAEDVTQAVFILLAKKAAGIKSAPLAGWLLRATHFVCRNAKDLIARRQFHERRAAAMKPEEIPPSQDPMWESYAPLLDEALAGLRQKDRDAVALRFFRGLNLRDVGAALGISEEAARKRVDRGIVRLRQAMTSKATVPAVAVLATQLATRGSEAAPAHLVQSITATAATATAKGTFVGTIAQKASHAMTLMKIKIAAAIIAAIGVAGAGAGTWVALATAASGTPEPQSTTQISPATQKSVTDLDYIHDLDSKDAAVRDKATEALVKPVEERSVAAQDTLLGQLKDSLVRAGPVGQFRARLVMAWIQGRVRFMDEGHDGLLIGIHYLEDHLDDASVARFSPQEFTHVAFRKNNDDDQWAFIIENTKTNDGDGAKRGLTLYYDPEKKQIVKVHNWGYASKEEYDAAMRDQNTQNAQLVKKARDQMKNQEATPASVKP